MKTAEFRALKKLSLTGITVPRCWRTSSGCSWMASLIEQKMMPSSASGEWGQQPGERGAAATQAEEGLQWLKERFTAAALRGRMSSPRSSGATPAHAWGAGGDLVA